MPVATAVRLPGPAGALFGDEPTTGEPRAPPQPTRRLGLGIPVRRASPYSRNLKFRVWVAAGLR
jgi:hypothetical protein